MSIELKVPDVGESIREVQIARWLKDEGDSVELDEPIAELETEKASVELPAPAKGTLSKILKQAGATVAVGSAIGEIEEGEGEPSGTKKQQKKKKKGKEKQRKEPKSEEPDEQDEREEQEEQEEAETTADEPAAQDSGEAAEAPDSEKLSGNGKRDAQSGAKIAAAAQRAVPATPSARRELRKHGLAAEEVTPRGDRLRADDVRRHVEESRRKEVDTDERGSSENAESELERSVPMSFIRRRIAQRLVEAQQRAALLTTFNEIDMSAVIGLRSKFREQFAEEHGTDLGYMPFFVKALVDGLRHYPELNAEVRGESIVYRDYYHIGIAVGGGEGLVVPVLRFAERMSFAEIEEAIADFAARAKTKQLEPAELQNGTFTISNGGIYGSLLSTPIVNPPQSGILGMHAIMDRPVAHEKQVVIRPMMYVALTYDHRVVDGREAVLFLKRVKSAIEEPARMLIEV